jgi:hypothetical protein
LRCSRELGGGTFTIPHDPFEVLYECTSRKDEFLRDLNGEFRDDHVLFNRGYERGGKWPGRRAVYFRVENPWEHSMIALNFAPPPVAHDAATQLAQVYLAAAVDPVATQARLQQLNEATQAYRDAIAQHEAAAAKATEIEARESAVAAKERDVASREAALTASQTQLQVASAAIADRDAAVRAKEAESDRREAEIAKRVAELDRRVESYRAALAG